MARRERGMAILYQTYGREDYATYACPYCHRYVHKINGRHICAQCGTLVDCNRLHPYMGADCLRWRAQLAGRETL